MLKTQLITISLIALVACTRNNSPQGGSCIQSKSVEADKNAGVESVSSSELEVPSLGGFLELKLDNKPSGVMCTAFLEVEKIPEGKTPEEIAVTIWTAKHCMSEANVTDAVFQLSTKNVDKAVAYVRMPIVLDVVKNMQALKSALGPESTTYNQFTAAYTEFSTRSREATQKLIEDSIKSVTSKQDADTADSLGASSDLITSANSTMLSEKLAFGKSLCADDRTMDASGRQKFCITHDDLGAYTGTLTLKSFRGSDTEAKTDKFLAAALLSAGSKQIADRAAIESDFQQAPKKGIYTEDLNSLATILTLWKQSFRLEAALTTKLAYIKACQGPCSGNDRNSFAAIYKEDAIAYADSNKLDGLIQDLADEMSARSNHWRAIATNYLAGHMDQLFFHTNVNYPGPNYDAAANSYYGSLLLRTLADEPGTPLLWRPYGLVFWGNAKNGKLAIFQGDSGSLLSIGGVIPISVASSLNNGPTSGGIPIATLPVYRTTPSITRTDGQNVAAGEARQYPEGFGSDVAANGSPVGPSGNGLPGSSDTTAAVTKSGSASATPGSGPATNASKADLEPAPNVAPSGSKESTGGDGVSPGGSSGCT